MDELEILSFALAIAVAAAIYLFIEIRTCQRQIKRLESQIAEKGSEWKLETLDRRTWDNDAKLEALCRHVGVKVEKSVSKWEVN